MKHTRLLFLTAASAALCLFSGCDGGELSPLEYAAKLATHCQFEPANSPAKLLTREQFALTFPVLNMGSSTTCLVSSRAGRLWFESGLVTRPGTNSHQCDFTIGSSGPRTDQAQTRRPEVVGNTNPAGATEAATNAPANAPAGSLSGQPNCSRVSNLKPAETLSSPTTERLLALRLNGDSSDLGHSHPWRVVAAGSLSSALARKGTYERAAVLSGPI